MLRSIVGPLEDEIKSLQDQLQQAHLEQVTGLLQELVTFDAERMSECHHWLFVSSMPNYLAKLCSCTARYSMQV